jgi:GNAT superfamily N-acetyltransferase
MESFKANQEILFTFFDLIRMAGSDLLIEDYKQNYSMILSKNGAWPNAVYNLKGMSFVNDFFQSSIGTKINQQQVFFLIDSENKEQIDVLVKSGIKVVDYWLSMYLYLEKEILIDIPTGIDISIIVEEGESLNQWVGLVARELFNSKSLDSKVFNYLLAHNVELVLMKKAGQVIGSSLIYYNTNKEACIFMVAIDKAHRGLGLGRLIMDYSLSRMKRRNIERCLLQSTRLGIPLYNSLGFKEDGRYYWMIKIK